MNTLTDSHPCKLGVAGSLFCLVATFSSASLADNPIVQTLYTADPAPLVHDGTLYVYTTHDEDVIVDDFFTMNEWRVYSSTDAVNWTDHGSPLAYTDFSWATSAAWAGQVTYRNGRFYFYVPMRIGGVSRIGVGVSDSPTGPFTDPLGQPLVESDCGDIDPTVFIDDDDQAYLYWGNPDLCYVTLNTDMISYSGGIQHVPMTTQSFGVRSDNERPTSYEEGPWLHKRDGRYYMVFAAGPLSEHIGYATSSDPTGPWTYGGVVMPTQGGSFTNHPGVIDYKGKSFFFYHNAALPGGGGFHRSVCVEEFAYGGDGSIPQMDMSSGGPSAVDTLNPYARVEGETIAWEEGIETEPCSEGGMNVSSIENGDYIKVEEVDFGSGAVSFEASVASANSGGSIELHLDSESGTLVGTCSVAGTGGWQTWVTTSCSVSGAAGIHDLYLVFTGGSGSLFNLDWWVFQPEDPIPGTGGAGGFGGAPGVGGSPGGSAGDVGSGGTGTGGDPGSGGTGTGGGNPGSGGTGTGGGSPGVGGMGVGGNPGSGGTGTGGSPGSGGTGTGGTGNLGSGGTGTGGNLGSGGAGVMTGSGGGAVIGSGGLGTAGLGEGASDDASSGDESGCACRSGPRSGGSPLPAALLLLLAGLVRRRRRAPWREQGNGACG